MPKHSSRTKKLNSLLDFVQFTHLVQKVKRVVLTNGEENWENDAEHSFQLALVSWYLIEHNKLNLDLGKVICISLAHDLVEAYAGDTFIYADSAILAGKEKREQEAAKLMKKNFPTFSSMHELIDEYETRQTPESRFVYALDKLIPILNIYLDKGRTWQREGVTLDQLLEAKTDKITLSPDIVPHYEEIVAILEQNLQLFSI